MLGTRLLRGRISAFFWLDSCRPRNCHAAFETDEIHSSFGTSATSAWETSVSHEKCLFDVVTSLLWALSMASLPFPESSDCLSVGGKFSLPRRRGQKVQLASPRRCGRKVRFASSLPPESSTRFSTVEKLRVESITQVFAANSYCSPTFVLQKIMAQLTVVASRVSVFPTCSRLSTTYSSALAIRDETS